MREILLLASLAVASPGFADEDCAWKSTFAGYEKQVEVVIRDEPEDLVEELRHHAEALQAGDSARAESIATKVRDEHAALRKIEAPGDLVEFHDTLVAFYGQGVEAVEATDPAGRKEAELGTWRAMREMFVTMRDLLVTHRCHRGDIDAIETQILPMIDDTIRNLEQKQTTEKRLDP